MWLIKLLMFIKPLPTIRTTFIHLQNAIMHVKTTLGRLVALLTSAAKLHQI